MSAAFIQTESDSSHLESLKPAQRGAEEDFRKERDSENQKKERGQTVRKEEDGAFGPQAGAETVLQFSCPSHLPPPSSVISESINKTWGDGGKTGVHERVVMWRYFS